MLTTFKLAMLNIYIDTKLSTKQLTITNHSNNYYQDGKDPIKLCTGSSKKRKQKAKRGLLR
jgi:hypothetical protein